MRRLLLALALLAPFPGTASAAVVDVYPGDEIEDGMVSITDARGQRNSLTLIARNGRVTISERGTAALQAGDGCRQRARRRVTCSVIGDYSYGLYAELGSGDDSLSLTDPGCNLVDIEIYAGAGNDRVALTTPSGGVVYGGPGGDMLRGSAVGDYLQGGSGSDRLFGRGGADVLVGDTTGPRWAASDLLDGGRGRDTASWEGRTRPVHVDLAAGFGGQRGEYDALRAVEDLSGGDGRDTLLGDRGRNVILGGPGADRLDGRGGGDLLDGGADTVFSSNEFDGARDRLRCGPGNDTVNDPDHDVVPPDCELLTSSSRGALDGQSIHVHPRSTSGVAAVETICSLSADVCTRQVTLRAHGRVLGRSATRDLHTGERAWVDVPISRPLPRGTPIEIVVVGTDDDGDGEGPYDYSFAWSVRR